MTDDTITGLHEMDLWSKHEDAVNRLHRLQRDEHAGHSHPGARLLIHHTEVIETAIAAHDGEEVGEHLAELTAALQEEITQQLAARDSGAALAATNRAIARQPRHRGAA